MTESRTILPVHGQDRSRPAFRALIKLGVVVLCLLQALAPASGAQDGEGDGARILRGVLVEGNERVRSDQLISALGLPIGEALDVEELSRGIDILFETFRVLVEVSQRSVGEDGVELLLKVQELARDLEPRFVGNVEISEETLLEWAQLRAGDGLYLYQSTRIRNRLLARYKEEGYFFAQIRGVERRGSMDPDTGAQVAPDVIFEIREGPKVRVRDVVFTGNDTLPNRGFFLFKSGLAQLAEIDLKGPRYFGLFTSAFVQEALDADLIAMREVYRDLGYLDAIVEVERLEFSADRSWVTIHVSVDEGGRYRIGSIDIEALEFIRNQSGRVIDARPTDLLFPEEELKELLTLEVGDIYERRRHRADEVELRNYYGKRGHISHRSVTRGDRWEWLEPELRVEEGEPVIHLTYRLVQGREISIREIKIQGNEHTRDGVIRRLITVKPGDVADPRLIERSRSRIEGTGFFSDPRDITHRLPDYFYEDTGDPNWKDLTYTIEEGQVITFTLSGGITSNSGAFAGVALNVNNFDASSTPSSFFNLVDELVQRRAFHGGGQQLTLSASPGTQVTTYNVSFSDPDIFDLYENPISLALFGFKRLRRYRSHDEDRVGIGFRVGRGLTTDSQVYAGYTFGSIEVDDIDPGPEPSLGDPFGAPRDLKIQEGENDLSFVQFGYVYRNRDRALSTRNGFLFSVDNAYYDDSVGSDFSFLKTTISTEYWHEFDDDPNIVSPYTHLQLGMGLGFPFGDTEEVPYTERYFLGGLNTLRGFRLRGVGPNENDFSNGGESSLYGTIEYRVPLTKQIQPGTYREIETLQGGLFFDFGVLGQDAGDFDFDELRTSVGFLFGISVPLPITFSFGFPLREGDGDRKRTFGFNIGF